MHIPYNVDALDILIFTLKLQIIFIQLLFKEGVTWSLLVYQLQVGSPSMVR